MATTFTLRLGKGKKRSKRKRTFLSEWIEHLRERSNVYRGQGMDFEAGLADAERADLEQLVKNLHHPSPRSQDQSSSEAGGSEPSYNGH